MTVKQRVINVYGGPGQGKSFFAKDLSVLLSRIGISNELITEYAKDVTWEENSQILQMQELVFAEQHRRLFRCIGKVEFLVTDSPILLSSIYAGSDYRFPSIHSLIREAYEFYDNINILVSRNERIPYQQNGRNQNEDESDELHLKIKNF